MLNLIKLKFCCNVCINLIFMNWQNISLQAQHNSVLKMKFVVTAKYLLSQKNQVSCNTSFIKNHTLLTYYQKCKYIELTSYIIRVPIEIN